MPTISWNWFCGLGIGEVIDLIQAWEKGEKQEILREVFISFLDDRIFRFEPGSMAETTSDAIIRVGGGAAIDAGLPGFLSLLTKGLNVKPLGWASVDDVNP